MVERTCKTCGGVITDPSRKVYCSVECNPNYKGIRGIHNTCKQCGKEFLRNTIDQQFCSAECRNNYLKDNKLYGEEAHHWQGGEVSVTCAFCRKEIRVKRYRTHSSDRIYCSRECHGKWLSKYGTGENASNWRGGNIKKICVICGKEFFVRRYIHNSGKGGKCCSNECRYKLKSMQMCGSGNPMYEDGKSKYPYCEKFNAEFKRRVRAFFNDKCMLCGKTKEENNNSVMSVHHIHNNKQACCDKSEQRFASLCRSCHSIISNYERYDKEKADEFITKLNDIIDTQYNGKCFYTRDEYYAKK